MKPFASPVSKTVTNAVASLRAALAHQQDFDVCWCRGSVAETIFQPLIASIERSGGSIQGMCYHSQHHTLLQASAGFEICCKDHSNEATSPLTCRQSKSIHAGGSLVSDVHVHSSSGKVTAVTSRSREGEETRHEADAVVFAIGITGTRAAKHEK